MKRCHLKRQKDDGSFGAMDGSLTVLVGSIVIYNCFFYVGNQYIIIDRWNLLNLTSIMMY